VPDDCDEENDYGEEVIRGALELWGQTPGRAFTVEGTLGYRRETRK
jgi:hypothetical protein